MEVGPLTAVAERGPSLRQASFPEDGRSGRPGLAVTGPAFGAALGAERDEVREVVHRGDVAALRDAHEAVRVEVVAEQE